MKLVEPGAVIAGKYVVERVIGRGGVGIVAAARHVTLRQLVALKFLRPEIQGDPEVTHRFLREAQVAAQIRSEHVTRVMDAGALEDGTVFLVFEYLAGRDLAAVLREDGPLPIADAVDYLLQACEAIGEAHALGIVHRDLKPANLFLTQAPDGSPFVKVLDFGLSKFNRSVTSTSLTADNHVIGSPHFMSPEQMRSSRDADARSDIWALGVVLFGLLTARVPFEGQFLTEICAAVMAGNPRSLLALRPDAPPELESVILRCLRTDPADRIQSVVELANALRPFDPTHGAMRADRIARVVVGTQLALELGAPRGAPQLPRSTSAAEPALPNVRDNAGHGSSPVSWAISVGRAQMMPVASTPPRAQHAQVAERSPALSRGADSALRAPIAPRRPLSALVAAGTISLFAGMAGALWLAPDAIRMVVDAPSEPSAASRPAPTEASAGAAASAEATPPFMPAPPPPAVAVPSSASPLSLHTAAPPAREAPLREVPPRSTRAASRPAPLASPALPTRKPSDEELILGLPR